MEPTNTLFSNDNIPDYFLDELKIICQRDEVLNSTFDDFLYCYNNTLNSFILVTKKFVFDVYYNSKDVFYCSIPTSRILNIFSHHRWSLGDFLVFDLSTNEEIILTINLREVQDLNYLKETIASCLCYSNYAPYQITYHNTKINSIQEMKRIESFVQYHDKKTVKLTKQENTEWFLLGKDKKIIERNKLFGKIKNQETNENFGKTIFIHKQPFVQTKEVIYRTPPKYTQPKKSNKEIYKENKKKGIVCCPKCGSTSVTTTNKKLSVKRGVVGGAMGTLVSPLGTAVGAVAGGLSSKKIYNVCMNCGHRWKP